MFLRQSTSQIIRFGPFLDSTDGVTPETALTIAQADMQLSKDGATFAQKNASGNATHDTDGWYSTTLNVTDTATTGELKIQINVAGALPVWEKWFVLTASAYDALQTGTFNNLGGTAQTGDAFLRLATYRLGELMSEVLASQPFTASLLADLTQDDPDNVGTQQFTAAALDRTADIILTGATHNITNSWGKRVRAFSGEILEDGTAQSGGNNTIQLAIGDITINDQFRRSKVIIVSGTGAKQEAIITGSVASTDTLTVTPAWLVNPDVTSEYIIIPAQSHQTVRNGGYDGSLIYVDTVNGNSGTQKGVNGTSTNPSNNLVDAYAIAANEMISSFAIEPGSTITLPASSTNRTFIGRSYDVLLNSADIDNSFFTGASITGIATAGSGNAPGFILCGIGAVTLPPCNGSECGFFGTFTLGSVGSFTFGASATVFDSTLIIDYGAGNNSSGFFLQSWGGGEVEIQNAGAGTGTYKFELNGLGHLIINANCSATTEVDVHGSVTIVNNASGITIVNLSAATGIELAVVDANVDQLLLDVAVLPTPSEVNAEVVDVMEVDTHAEPSGAVGATATLKDAIMWTKTKGRNKMTQTATDTLLRNDADSGTIATSPVSDDTTTFIRNKFT